MCAINPKHEMSFLLKVYTSIEISRENFEKEVFKRILEMEKELNKDGKFRFHTWEE